MSTSSSSRRAGRLLAVDPGLRAVGLALFHDGVLVRAGAVRGPAEGRRGEVAPRGPGVWSALAVAVEAWVYEVVPVSALSGPCTVVVEVMKVRVKGKGDPADLLELAGVGGAIVGRLSSWSAEGVEPERWKGQVPRDVMGRRVEEHLRAEDLWSRVEVPSRATELNDAMHAVGLGRWWLAR